MTAVNKQHKTINAVIQTAHNSFLQGVSIACYAEPRISYYRDVYPSHAVTESKRRKLGSRNLHGQIAQGLQFSGQKVHPEIRKGSPRVRALNEKGVGKIRNFQPVSRRISQTVQDRTKVTIND